MSRNAGWSYPRVAIVLVAVLAWASPGFAILEPNVLVVYNSASPDGPTIAQEYQEIHPGVRLVGVSLPGVGEEISGQDYLDKVRAPILQSLTATTDVIVTTKGMPLRINNPYKSGLGVSQSNWSAYSSLESELTRIDTVDSLKAMGWQSVLFSPNPAVANPYDLRNGSKPEQPFSHATFGIRLTSRLDGFTAADVVASLHHAQAAVKDFSTDTFVLDDDPNAPRATSDKIPALKALLDGRGLSGNYVYDSTTTFLTSAPGPVLGYVSHGTYGGGSPAAPPSVPSYVLSRLAFTPAPGAFFQSYESFNAYSFIQGNNRTGAAGPQALVAEWIAKGGSAALGAVEEPKAGTTAEEDQVVRMMLDGYTWAEAAWSATWQLSYVNTVVGDPLMQWNDPPIPGDVNLDGLVGPEDFAIVKDKFGVTGLSTVDRASWAQGDVNLDGQVGPEDFGILKANFGDSAGAGAPVTALPEPASLALLLAGGLLLARRRNAR